MVLMTKRCYKYSSVTYSQRSIWQKYISHVLETASTFHSPIIIFILLKNPFRNYTNILTFMPSGQFLTFVCVIQNKLKKNRNSLRCPISHIEGLARKVRRRSVTCWDSTTRLNMRDLREKGHRNAICRDIMTRRDWRDDCEIVTQKRQLNGQKHKIACC